MYAEACFLRCLANLGRLLVARHRLDFDRLESGVLRDRFKMQMKVKALSAEAKASAMILAALPPGVMFMVNASSPEYINPLFATRTGNLFILIGLAWMTVGILVMRKMINFDF